MTDEDREAVRERPASPRPRDYAVLARAAAGAPPRRRARDAQADQAGLARRAAILEGLAALDPEPSEIDAALARIVAELGEPSGPTRALAALVRDEWQAARDAPEAWAWLVAEALRAGQRGERRSGARDAP